MRPRARVLETQKALFAWVAGADVDVGAERLAFLHVSCIQDDFLADARERLAKGDKVKAGGEGRLRGGSEVWVKRKDQKGLKVTMVESQRETCRESTLF